MRPCGRSRRSTHSCQGCVRFSRRNSHPNGVVIVSATPQQLYNLAVARTQASMLGPAQRVARMMQPWFDLVLIDEASQLDVAMSTLVVSKAADGAAFVLAGDDLQLAPIQRGTQERSLGKARAFTATSVKAPNQLRHTPAISSTRRTR